MPLPVSLQQHTKSIDQAFEILSLAGDSSPSTRMESTLLKTQISAMETVANTEDPSLHSSVSRVYLDQMNQGNEALRYPGSDHQKEKQVTDLLIARLYILSLGFNVPTEDGNISDAQAKINRLHLLYNSFSAATELISYFKDGTVDDVNKTLTADDESDGTLKYMPDLYFTSLFQATALLFRFLATYPAPLDWQRRNAIKAIQDAHFIFQSFPDRREFVRAAIHIEAMIDILRTSAEGVMNDLVVTNKLGASVMFDAIFYACRHRNIDPRTGRPLEPQAWKTVNETFAERLPKAPSQTTRNDTPVPGPNNHDTSQDIQTLMPSELNQDWWEEWDKYIDLFQVGDDTTMDF